MTERPLAITTQIATPIQAALNSAASVSANDALPVSESVDEEPYTIKCICDYYDDDGNTIYCEKCDTWQHIECFYPGRVDDASREEFDHSCADCKPRPLDRRHATERQRQQRQNKLTNDGSGERKGKRPPSKGQKKKTKPADLQVGGLHDHDGHKHGSPHEHHPQTKKSKGHRASQSVSSIKRSPPLHARHNSHAHPPSPAQTPPDLPQDFQVHSYSDSFLRLYDGEDAVQENPTNSFASLSVTNSMSSWLRDSESLQKDTGIRDKDEVFQYLKLPVHTLKWPKLVVERKDAIINDAALSWRYLTTPTALPHSGRIGELNGLVGFQKDYCEDMENKWIEMAHPRPLIFFHPRLPLFIDTRHEGSICRYVRRSCRANTTLETFIASGSEYHFWLVSERPLRENEQITLPWDFRFPSHLRSRYLHLLNLGDDDGTPSDGTGISDAEYDQLTATISLVLSDHGGCACDLGNDCAFARFHRNYHGRAHPQTNGVKSKKGRKPKQHHVSPSSTGHATNSRAASEGHLEHGDDEDSRSVSGSSRSKPQSRDMTPLQGGAETNGVIQEPSDREKRKLAMVEDTFRKMEQGQPARKKKRPSDGSTMSVAGSSTTPQPPSKARKGSIAPRTSVSQPPTSGANNSRPRQYVDASTSRRQSGSPFSGVSPTATLPSPGHLAYRNASTPGRSRQTSTAPKSTYTDSSTQTDEVDHAWWKQPKPKTPRTVVPLAKRLLQNRSRIRAQQESQVNGAVGPINGGEDLSTQTSPVVPVPVPMDLDTAVQEERPSESPTDSKDRKASISSSTPSADIPTVDVNMSEAPAIVISNAIKPPPPPWPGQPNITRGRGSSPNQKSPDLRVQMPPTPTFTSPNLSGPLSGSVTPSSASGSISQSPLGTLHFPSAFPTATVNGVGQHSSPVKTTKKLSLSDYKASRMKRNESSTAVKPTGGNSPTATLAALKSLSTIEESKSNNILEGSTIVDTPITEKSSDPLTPAPKVETPSGQTNGTL